MSYLLETVLAVVALVATGVCSYAMVAYIKVVVADKENLKVWKTTATAAKAEERLLTLEGEVLAIQRVLKAVGTPSRRL